MIAQLENNCISMSVLFVALITSWPRLSISRSFSLADYTRPTDNDWKIIPFLTVFQMERHLAEDPVFREEHNEMLAKLDIPIERSRLLQAPITNLKQLDAGFTRSRFGKLPSLRRSNLIVSCDKLK